MRIVMVVRMGMRVSKEGIDSFRYDDGEGGSNEESGAQNGDQVEPVFRKRKC